ncbi:diphthine methyltransferase [Anopheles ziemanni]|uniref:diphthine methyltransferase n=1 Tax=Anopheles coustani TaxID=139045 RepID=UPI002658FF02|nr:diphthine methyltransferase [Anopheles coustani]XP_058173854.1 diphthine methyltransferase [Anopheles ziemanni]
MVQLGFKTLVSYDTEQSADSVEWCPHEGWQNIFVCGTYQLERDDATSTANREGRILLHKYDADGPEPLVLLQTIQRKAVLDQKWNPIYTDRLAVAGADGSVAVYRLDLAEDPRLELQSSAILRGEETDGRNILALALEWSSDGKRLVATDSHGCVEVFSFGDTALLPIHNWKGHGFEAWTCTFSQHHEDVVYSGGDDTFLCAYDIRCPKEPVLKTKNKSHTAGVTSLLSPKHKDHALLTGSYDEMIRIFDDRQLKHNVAEHGLNGGVWRLRSNPQGHPERILCACMYHNFSVVELTTNGTFELIGEYGEHESICYGCDWQRIESKENVRNIIATCSFYDHKLCVVEVS